MRCGTLRGIIPVLVLPSSSPDMYILLPSPCQPFCPSARGVMQGITTGTRPESRNWTSSSVPLARRGVANFFHTLPIHKDTTELRAQGEPSSSLEILTSPCPSYDPARCILCSCPLVRLLLGPYLSSPLSNPTCSCPAHGPWKNKGLP